MPPSEFQQTSDPHRAALFGTVYSGFREGFQASPPYAPKPEDSSKYLARIPVEDAGRIAVSARLRGRAMQAAAANDLAAAARWLRTSQKVLKTEQMGPESEASALQMHYGVESYLAYRAGDFDRARDTMREAIRLVNRLESEFGYDFVDGRRIHLARNLTRLEAHGGDALVAASLLYDLMHYACGADEAWPYPDLGSPSAARRADATESHMVFNQLARELALLYVHSLSETWPRLTVHLVTTRDRTTSRESGDERLLSLHSWITLKEHLCGGADGAFLRGCAAFFSEGPVVPALWYAVALDVMEICASISTPAACTLSELLQEHVGPVEQLRMIEYQRIWRTAAPPVSAEQPPGRPDRPRIGAFA